MCSIVQLCWCIVCLPQGEQGLQGPPGPFEYVDPPEDLYIKGEQVGFIYFLLWLLQAVQNLYFLLLPFSFVFCRSPVRVFSFLLLLVCIFRFVNSNVGFTKFTGSNLKCSCLSNFDLWCFIFFKFLFCRVLKELKDSVDHMACQYAYIWDGIFVKDLIDLWSDYKKNSDEEFCLWFQGLDSLPGVKGEKGILGFPGPRVSVLPSLHYLHCLNAINWQLLLSKEGHGMFTFR